MNRKTKTWLYLTPFFIFMFLAGFLLQGLFSDPRELESALVGRPVPQFQLPDLYDPEKLHDSRAIAKGPLLLNVWATWCPTCRAEHDYLNKLAADGVQIVGLNYKDEPAKARRWLAELGDPYRINLLDERGLLALDLGVYGAPETYLIDAGGVIRYRHVGDVNERVWSTTLQPLYRQMLSEQAGGA